MSEDTKNTDESRRSFIKSAGVLAAGAGLTAAAGGAAFAQTDDDASFIAKTLLEKRHS